MPERLKEHLMEILKAEDGGDSAVELLDGFRRMMTMYHCAIREVQTKFEILSEGLAANDPERNPIQNIQSRVKAPMSIADKLRRKGVAFTLENIAAHLNDIAGVRVVCKFIDDIYTIAKMFCSQDDVTVIDVKDYIKAPKQNGYRSYHMIVEIPVFFAYSRQSVRVEVQLRTIAMDFWASLEHELKYKKNVEDAKQLSEELQSCAEEIYAIDHRMRTIKNRIRNE